MDKRGVTGAICRRGSALALGLLLAVSAAQAAEVYVYREPAGTRLFGELGRLYDDEWLKAHGWQGSLAELMVDAPDAAGTSGRRRKKS